MKTFYFIFLILIFASCSPENMLNRKLDGEWTLVSVNGQKTDANSTKKITFSKDGKGGDVLYTTINNNVTETKKGIYALIKTNSISIAFPNDAFGSGYETEVYNFTNNSKTELTLTQERNKNTFVYTKN
jgi:hypothetical protein